MFSITHSEFLKSSSKLSECPVEQLPEFAFIGRSNVGKSSLINYLTGRKSLAKTSAVPGKTQLINHFLLKTDLQAFPELYLVDLPGYGYAKTSKTKQKTFTPMISSYVRGSKSLVNLFLLIDSRHVDQKIDAEFIEFLGINKIPFSIVLTKADKLSKNAQAKAIADIKRFLKKDWEELPFISLASALNKEGAEEIRKKIASDLSFLK